MKRSTVKELKNFNQQKQMFGKNWIKMNKFDVEQRSSNINYVKQDLLEQYKTSNKKSRKGTMHGTSFMNDPNYINPANQTNNELSRLLAPNIFDKIHKEELDEDTKKEIRLRKGTPLSCMVRKEGEGETAQVEQGAGHLRSRGSSTYSLVIE